MLDMRCNKGYNKGVETQTVATTNTFTLVEAVTPQPVSEPSAANRRFTFSFYRSAQVQQPQ